MAKSRKQRERLQVRRKMEQKQPTKAREIREMMARLDDIPISPFTGQPDVTIRRSEK